MTQASKIPATAEDKAKVATSNPEQLQQFEADDLRSLVSFEDAMRLLRDQLGAEAIVDAQDSIGDGFAMLDDKDRLINTPLVFVQWVFAPGDWKNEQGEVGQFVVARIMTDTGGKYIITDGGTGICQQLADFTQRTGRTAGLLCKRGLRKSEYNHPEFGPGVTHYLNV